MAVVNEIIDLLVCRKIHGCGCVADDPVPRKSVEYQQRRVSSKYRHEVADRMSGGTVCP